MGRRESPSCHEKAVKREEVNEILGWWDVGDAGVCT